jgi:hypothetical protein
MHIEGYFERKDPKNDMSEIVYRGLQFETRLKPECVKKIAQKVIPAHASNLFFGGVINGKTRFRIALTDAATSSFPRFMYEIMNWEGNSCHQNDGTKYSGADQLNSIMGVTP